MCRFKIRVIKLGLFLSTFIIQGFASQKTLSVLQNSSELLKNVSVLEKQLFGDQKLNTYVVAVADDKKIIWSKYKNGFNSSNKFIAWSMTKSIFNLIFGMAVAKYPNVISLEDSICKHIDKNKFADHCKIKVSNLFSFCSGIIWSENYETNPYDSDVVSMLYGKGRNNMAEFVLSRAVDKAKVGKQFNYSSGDTVLLSYVLRKAIGEKAYLDLIFNFFPNQLGLKNFTFEKDTFGTAIASSYAHLTVADAVRIGQFILRNGKSISGTEILPVNWLKNATKHNSCFALYPPKKSEQFVAGKHWWLIVDPKVSPKHGDSIVLVGYAHQYIIVNQKLNKVLVRFGNDVGLKSDFIEKAWSFLLQESI